MLPHAFPFRLVETQEGGGVVVTLSAGGTWWRGRQGPPAVLALEILAQAAILVLARGDGQEGSRQEGRGLLAGVDRASFHRPLSPGDRLDARVELRGRFGRLVKVTGSLIRQDGEVVTEADLLLALEE